MECLDSLKLSALRLCSFLCGHAGGATPRSYLAWLPMAFASGLWIPISQLPDVVQSVAVALPPYHFVQLALGTIGASEGGSPVVHAAAVLGFTLLFLVVAAWGFRRDEGRTYG